MRLRRPRGREFPRSIDLCGRRDREFAAKVRHRPRRSPGRPRRARGAEANRGRPFAFLANPSAHRSLRGGPRARTPPLVALCARTPMRPSLFVATAVLGAAALAPGCSANPLLVGHEIGGGGPSACTSGGGICVLDVVACTTEAPGSAQDCTPSDDPTGAGGNRCCLTFPDPNPAPDAGPSGAPPGNKDSGNSDDVGVNACESAGGTCVGASVACASSAPQAAQDCNNVPQAGAVCCLTLRDAGPPGPEAGPVDAGPRNDGGGAKDGGAPACASAGGTCIDSSRPCGNNAPLSAQDCPFVTGGSFCCISPL